MKDTRLTQQEETERQIKMNKRLMWLFIVLDILVLGYIVYQFAMIFTK